MLLFLLAACGVCPPMTDIVVSGGTIEEQGLVEQALADIASWTGRESVCVAEVALVSSLPDDRLGRYESNTGLVEVLSGQEDPRRTATHEICHGIDFDDRIAARHSEDFPYDRSAPDYALRDERSRAREAFAITCEAGPRNLQVAIALAERCELDVHLAGAERVLDEVFEVADPFEPTDPGFERVAGATWSAPEGWEVPVPLFVRASGQGNLVVPIISNGSVAVAHLDPATGDEQFGPFTDFQRTPWPGEALPRSWRGVWIAEWGTDALASLEAPLANGASVTGVVGWRDGAWMLPSDPCAGLGAAPVEIDGGPWLVETDGQTVTWDRWVIR